MLNVLLLHFYIASSITNFILFLVCTAIQNIFWMDRFINAFVIIIIIISRIFIFFQLDKTPYPVNTKHLDNICTMFDQCRRRWAGVVQMFFCLLGNPPHLNERHIRVTTRQLQLPRQATLVIFPSNLFFHLLSCRFHYYPVEILRWRWLEWDSYVG